MPSLLISRETMARVFEFSSVNFPFKEMVLCFSLFLCFHDKLCTDVDYLIQNLLHVCFYFEVARQVRENIMNKAQRQALVNRQVFKLLQMLLRLTIQHMPFFIWQGLCASLIVWKWAYQIDLGLLTTVFFLLQ